VPLPDWVLSEGLSGCVEQLLRRSEAWLVGVVRVDGVVHAVLQKIRGGLRSINTYSLVGAFMGCNSNSL
jgi:hypothetical protein